MARTPSPAVFVLFGACGDLARRKIIPAISNLAQNGLLPSSFAVLGVGRDDLSDEAFREMMRPSLEKGGGGAAAKQITDALLAGFYYRKFLDSDPDASDLLDRRLREIDKERATRGNRLFYLSTPPSAFFPIIDRLAEYRTLSRRDLGEGTPSNDHRIIIEKPFGRDLESAVSLNSKLLSAFEEREIYRIDHYLGKETVQNVLVLRFANSIFEPLWNHRYIDHVQITVAETLGLEGRGGYYEEAGALRDMIQNHLLQLLCLVAMEPPADLDPESSRDERRKVLRCIRPIDHREVALSTVRGQYGPGSIAGKSVPGYREEPGVRAESSTETYAAMRVDIDNWRWAGVPFFIRTGKRLPKKVSEVAIRFKDVPHRLFDRELGSQPIDANVLALRIQPDEGISLKFGSKVPGHDIRIRPVKMDFQYGNAFGAAPPDAYERLVLDAMIGDPTLFIRGDVAEEAWKLVMPTLEVWADEKPKFANYAAGSYGPSAADDLLEVEGAQWRRL